MKQLIHDIRAAWPRERRFTWRGWVLLGVLGGLMVVAVRGWNPVGVVQSFVMARWGSTDLFTMGIALNGMMLVFIGQYAISVPTMLGLIPAVALVRPSMTWLLFPALFALSFATSIFHLSLWFLPPLPLGLGPDEWRMLADMIVSVIWAGVLWRVFRNWFAAAWVLAFTAFMYVTSIFVLEPWHAAQPPGSRWFLDWCGWGWLPEIIAYHVLLPLGLVFIALRSWHVSPAHLCRGCGYDRRGLAAAAACPECGTPSVTVAEATPNPARTTP